MNLEMLNPEVGFKLPAVTREIVFEKMYQYSGRFGGWFLNSVHTDRNQANAAGFPNALCQGTMILNFASEAMFSIYKEFWIRNSKISVAFLKAVFPGDIVTIKSILKEKRNITAGTQLTFDIWAENLSQERVMVGIATVIIDQNV